MKKKVLIATTVVFTVATSMFTGFHLGKAYAIKDYTTHKMVGVVVDSENIRTLDGNGWGYDTELEKGTPIKVEFSTKVVGVKELDIK
jgi:hypothetical protein